jgi:hypothetical protein
MSESREATRVRQILAAVKPLAAEYYQLTGKPLGVTGEVAEYVIRATHWRISSSVQPVPTSAKGTAKRTTCRAKTLFRCLPSGHSRARIISTAPHSTS